MSGTEGRSLVWLLYLFHNHISWSCSSGSARPNPTPIWIRIQCKILHQYDGQETASLWMGVAPSIQSAAFGAMHGGGAGGADCNWTCCVRPSGYVENVRDEYTSMLVDTAPTSGAFQPLSDYAAAKSMHPRYPWLALRSCVEHSRMATLFSTRSWWPTEIQAT